MGKHTEADKEKPVISSMSIGTSDSSNPEPFAIEVIPENKVLLEWILDKKAGKENEQEAVSSWM
jgi:hypothetical protein